MFKIAWYREVHTLHFTVCSKSQPPVARGVGIFTCKQTTQRRMRVLANGHSAPTAPVGETALSQLTPIITLCSSHPLFYKYVLMYFYPWFVHFPKECKPIIIFVSMHPHMQWNISVLGIFHPWMCCLCFIWIAMNTLMDAVPSPGPTFTNMD